MDNEDDNQDYDDLWFNWTDDVVLPMLAGFVLVGILVVLAKWSNGF